MGVVQSLFGYLPDGRKVTKYTLSQKGGILCSVLDLGGIIQELRVPDAKGEYADVVCGFIPRSPRCISIRPISLMKICL